MPQMKPMSWILMLLTFTMLLLMTSNLMFFTHNKNKKKLNQMTKSKPPEYDN